MAEINLSGSGTPEAELIMFLKTTFNKALADSLEDVGADMQSALAKHIETDVYAKYSPTEYERRGDGGLLGQAMAARIYPGGNRVSIEFKPNGNHPKENEWREDGVYPVHGDDLIGRIEQWNPKYSYRPKHKRLPKRPFWQKFVEEMVDDGTVEYYLANAMRRRDIELVEDGKITREPADGSY